MIAFIDMDGVLADFTGGVLAAHGQPDWYDRHPAVRGDAAWGIDELMFPGDRSRFWSVCESQDFWANLPKTPDCDEIFAAVTAKVNEVYLLTSHSQNLGSVPGKILWLRKYFPQMERRTIFTSHKQLMSGRGRVLIDDNTANCRKFEAAGGIAYLVPRLWNERCGSQMIGYCMVDDLKWCLDVWSYGNGEGLPATAFDCVS